MGQERFPKDLLTRSKKVKKSNGEGTIVTRRTPSGQVADIARLDTD